MILSARRFSLRRNPTSLRLISPSRNKSVGYLRSRSLLLSDGVEATQGQSSSWGWHPRTPHAGMPRPAKTVRSAGAVSVIPGRRMSCCCLSRSWGLHICHTTRHEHCGLLTQLIFDYRRSAVSCHFTHHIGSLNSLHLAIAGCRPTFELHSSICVPSVVVAAFRLAAMQSTSSHRSNGQARHSCSVKFALARFAAEHQHLRRIGVLWLSPVAVNLHSCVLGSFPFSYSGRSPAAQPAQIFPYSRCRCRLACTASVSPTIAAAR